MSNDVFEIFSDFIKLKIFVLPKATTKLGFRPYDTLVFGESICGPFFIITFTKLWRNHLSANWCYVEGISISTFAVLSTILNWSTASYFTLQLRDKLHSILIEINHINELTQTDLEISLILKKFRAVGCVAYASIFLFLCGTFDSFSNEGPDFFEKGLDVFIAYVGTSVSNFFRSSWVILSLSMGCTLLSITANQLLILAGSDVKNIKACKLIQLKIISVGNKTHNSFGSTFLCTIFYTFYITLLVLWTKFVPEDACYMKDYTYLMIACCIVLVIILKIVVYSTRIVSKLLVRILKSGSSR